MNATNDQDHGVAARDAATEDDADRNSRAGRDDRDIHDAVGMVRRVREERNVWRGSSPFGTLTVAACECLTWGRDNAASVLHLEHHPNCEHYKPEHPIRELLLRLVDGIEAWAADEDGIHEACWNAYQDACCVLGQYDRPSKQEPV